jgi:hypothetical protein
MSRSRRGARPRRGGEGLNQGGARGVGAVRAQLFAQGEAAPVLDQTFAINTASAGVRVEAVPPGRGYEALVSACEGPEKVARWVGQGDQIDIAAGQTSARAIYLLPAEGFVCAGAGEGAAPGQARAFAAAWSPDGRGALIVGGLTRWTEGGEAVATAQILRYLRYEGRFEAAGALSGPSALAVSVEARRGPGEGRSLLLYGGVGRLVEGAGGALSGVLHFGPRWGRGRGGCRGCWGTGRRRRGEGRRCRGGSGRAWALARARTATWW